MKRFVLFCLLLLVTTGASAQTLPPELYSDYVAPTVTMDIQMELVEYWAPWSIPDPVGTHIMFGSVEFGMFGAAIQTTTVATLVCDGLPYCVAINPIPVNIHTTFPWVPGYHTYISLYGDQVAPSFNVLSVHLDDVPHYALWYSGAFVDTTGYVINPNAFFSVYYVSPATVPILPYMPRGIWNNGG